MKCDFDWATMLGELEAFAEAYGHLRVEEETRRYRVLAGWWADVRTGLDRLTYEQILDLDKVGFFRRLDQRWLDRYAQLRKFKEGTGNCRVRKPGSGNAQLTSWVGTQRKQVETMIPWRRKLLTDLGFDWGPHETYWRVRYEELVEFERKHGHTDVPRNWAENLELAGWVMTQRHKIANPTREQIALLEKVGFDWNPHETAWMERYEELKAFQRKHGHCNVLVEKSELGKWVHKQRGIGKNMPAYRKELLTRIGFCWGEKPHDAWMRNYEELKGYHIVHGRSPRQDGSPLGAWVGNQRTAHRTGRMPRERKRLLDEIGFVWQFYARRPPA